MHKREQLKRKQLTRILISQLFRQNCMSPTQPKRMITKHKRFTPFSTHTITWVGVACLQPHSRFYKIVAEGFVHKRNDRVYKREQTKHKLLTRILISQLLLQKCMSPTQPKRMITKHKRFGWHVSSFTQGFIK